MPGAGASGPGLPIIRPMRTPYAAAPIRSAVLLLALALFCAVTRWGESYVTFAAKSWGAWVSGRQLPLARRALVIYDKTYPVLLYLDEVAPPDAVILFPPRQFVIDQLNRKGEIPLLASPSSAYNFIYPRVPVHYGDPSPWKERITHVLIWEHWGLDLVAPGEKPTEENRVRLVPWPSGRKAPW
jgi:hypothetical protein